MIKKIGIENFRIFKDYAEFELAPITILTGPNNSGKSSFLKMINLIQQSVNSLNSLNVLNFMEESNNLGTFDNVKSWNSKNENITITFDFPLDYFDKDFYLQLSYRKMGEDGFLKSFKIFNEDIDLLLIDDIIIEYGNNYQSFIYAESGYEYFYSFNLEYFKYFIYQEMLKKASYYDNSIIKSYYDYYKKFRKKGKDSYNFLGGSPNLLEFKEFKNNLDLFIDEKTIGVEGFLPLREYVKINYPEVYEDLLNKHKDFLFYTYYYRNEDGKRIRLNDNHEFSILKDDLLLIEKNIKNSRIWIDNYHLKNRNSDIFTDSYIDLDEPYYFWKERNSIKDYVPKKIINEFTYENFDEFITIDIEAENRSIFEKIVFKNIHSTLEKLKFSLKRFNFVSAQRSAKNRFLTSQSSDDIYSISKLYCQLELDLDINFIKESLKLLDIEGELKISRIEGEITIVSLNFNGKNINIADLGYGYSQIIPILLKIVIESHLNETEKSSFMFQESVETLTGLDSIKPVIIIEEPEANLHPNLKSKLADVLVLAYKTFGIHFILETHSEYLIRKLQYLTAKKEIEPEKDVNIYYFNNDEYVNDKEPKVKEIKIDEFGGLTDSFGPGFFDEATNLKFELMKVNKAQKN